MKKIYESLESFLDNATDEELNQIFDSVKCWNDVGPTVEEYFEYLQTTNNDDKVLN